MKRELSKDFIPKSETWANGQMNGYLTRLKTDLKTDGEQCLDGRTDIFKLREFVKGSLVNYSSNKITKENIRTNTSYINSKQNKSNTKYSVIVGPVDFKASLIKQG